MKDPAWVFVNNEIGIIVEAPTLKDAAEIYLFKYSTHHKPLHIIPISDIYHESSTTKQCRENR